MATEGTPRAMSKQPNDPRTVEEIRQRAVEAHPIELEEPLDTLDKPLVIECAYPGWQPRRWPEPETYGDELPPNFEPGGIRYPAVPCSVEEQVEELLEAIEAGCAATHVHPRDPEDCLANNAPELVAEVYEGVFAEADPVSIQHSWHLTDDGGVDFIEPAEALLEAAAGANDLIQAAVVLWPPMNSYPNGYADAVEEALAWYHDHDIKPVHKLRGSYHGRELHRTVIENGYPVEDPLVVIHDMGHPYGWPMDSAIWSPVELLSTIEQTKERFPGCVTGVYSGNRNWMPTTMRAILAGVDVVRVGIEDAYWMYPHRDEVIQHNFDCVRKITDFCDLVGREVATPEQAREVLGLAG